jgi:hypothetical protein
MRVAQYKYKYTKSMRDEGKFEHVQKLYTHKTDDEKRERVREMNGNEFCFEAEERWRA